MNEQYIAKVFKVLGEPSRLKIIKLLTLQSMCVCEISEVLDMRQPRVSQHLRTLKEVDLVTDFKQGYRTYHELERDKLEKIWREFSTFLGASLDDLSESEDYCDIRKRLDSLSMPDEK